MLPALFARIEDQRETLVDLTRELVQIPTVNPPGNAYEACARHLGERLAAMGFATTYVRARGAIGDSDRFPRVNLIARYEGRGPGACVHFNGHIDVVEPGDGWSVDPFAGAVQSGRLYGRGACRHERRDRGCGRGPREHPSGGHRVLRCARALGDRGRGVRAAMAGSRILPSAAGSRRPGSTT